MCGSNDRFGHVNNAVYYEFIDSSVNRHLASNSADDSMRFVAQSSCTYLKPFSYPSIVECGLSIVKIGRSSATYGIGIFAHPSTTSQPQEEDEVQRADRLCAEATFVHVHVDGNGRPHPIPQHVRSVLETLLVSPHES